MAVRKSWVDAQPDAFTAPVASSSRTTPSTSASSVDFNASTSATTPIRSPSSRAAHSVSVSSATRARMPASSTTLLGELDMQAFNQPAPTVPGAENPLLWKAILSFALAPGTQVGRAP